MAKRPSKLISVLAIGVMVAFSQCQQPDPEPMVISGTAPGFEGRMISLIRLDPQTSERLLLDTARVDTAARYRLSAIVPDTPYLQLSVQAGPELLLVADAPAIEVQLTGNTYTTKQSPGSAEIAEFIASMKQYLATRDRSFARWQNALLQKNQDSLHMATRQQYVADSSTMSPAMVAQVKQYQSAAAAAYAMGVLASYLNATETRELGQWLQLQHRWPMPTPPMPDTTPTLADTSRVLPDSVR